MILALVLLYKLIDVKIKNRVESYVCAIVIWTVYMFFDLEILSVFHAITKFTLWATWITLDVFLTSILIVYSKHNRGTIKKRDNSNRSFIFICFVIAVFVIALSVKMVPYNWDSMTYHLPRIYHWYHNRSIAHYSTNVVRQIASPVLGDFVNLNVYVLSGGSDRLVNLLQSFSYLTNAILVFEITHKLGCKKEWCIMASVLFMTMPIAFAEAFTTQVDNFAALWLLLYVYLLIDFVDVKQRLVFSRRTLVKVMILGLCVSFGYLTKPSVGIGMIIYVLWLLVISIVRKDSIKVVFQLIVCMLPGMIIVLFPEIIRNFCTFHAFSAPIAGAQQLIGTLEGKYVVVNFVKNFAFNLPCIWLYQSSVLIYRCVCFLAKILDVDINNPAIAENGGTYRASDVQSYNCDIATNPVIVWLLVGIIFLLVFRIRQIGKKQLTSLGGGYVVAAILSFLTFNAILRWEPFVSRYMLPYLALLCPAITFTLEKGLEGLYRDNVKIAAMSVIYFLCFIDLYGGIVYHGGLAFRSTRDEGEGYFAVRTEIESSYKDAVDYIKKQDYKTVGLCIGEDSYEYPLLCMLGENMVIKHVDVQNVSNMYQDTAFIPDVIMVSGRTLDKSWGIDYGYYCVLAAEEMQIYTRYIAARETV